jgi:hypothetical protein
MEENCSYTKELLMGGAKERMKIAWVKWVDVCRPKECGGLGIRNLRLVNIALLTKWRWRLLTSNDLVWKSVLMAKYGKDIVGRIFADWHFSILIRRRISVGTS